jgi:enoyl-CoA hydratase
MSESPVTVNDHGPVRQITVDRPDKLNALDRDTLLALETAFADAAAAEDVRVVVLTGAGPKAFVAGADIAGMHGMDPGQAYAFASLGQRVMDRIEHMPKPVIAMMNGYALGGGLELALACHLRVAAASARLGQAEINLGLIPGFGGSQRLLRLVGRGATLELCLLGTAVDAQRAYQLGLVNRVVADEALHQATFDIAAQLAASAPLALRGILDTVLAGGECPLEQGLALERARFGLLFASEDSREGTAAFLERRKPQFRNR